MEHSADLWNYFYRGIIAFGVTAKALGDDQLFQSIREFVDEFAKISGDDYQSKQWAET